MSFALLMLLGAAPLQWSDGNQQRQAWPDASAIAEIEPSAQGAAALRGLDEKATPTSGSPRVALWRLSASNAADVLAKLDSKLPGHFAPVFHDEQSPASKLRVPAGDVLVWLHSAAEAKRFVEQRGLVLRKDLGAGLLLVQSAPGAATLSLAATLRADKRVKTVMPNWWLRAVRR